MTKLGPSNKTGAFFGSLFILAAVSLALTGCILGTPTPAGPTSPAAAGSGTPAQAQATPAATSPTREAQATLPAATSSAGVSAASPTPLRAATRTATRTANRRYSSLPPQTIDVSAEYTATIRTNMGSIMVELFPGQAPVTVNNFVFLAENRFYDGLIFHRVIEDFMVQGGDPSGNGTGGPGYHFQDEISPGLAFDVPGKLAMANAGAGTGTNGSQFFITTVPTPHLDGNHTIFGQVTSGQDVVDSISRVSANAVDRPQQPVMIEGIDIRSTPR